MKLFLQIEDPLLLESLGELLPQIANMSWGKGQADADVVITDRDVSPEDVRFFKIEKTSPFHFETLLKNLEKKVSRGDVLFAGFVYDPRLRHLNSRETGEKTVLTEKEGDLLLYFLEKKGQDILRETLIKDVWGYREDVDSHTLETHIYRLRQKIEEDPKSPELLLTTPGGYRLQA